MTAGGSVAVYEEKWLGWRRTFVLYHDRIEASYANTLGGRGQATIPLDLVLDHREREWVKHNKLHGVVAACCMLITLPASLFMWEYVGGVVRTVASIVLGVGPHRPNRVHHFGSPSS